MIELRFRGVLFEARGAYGTVVESAFDVPFTEAGVLSAFPEEAAVDKTAQRLFAQAKYAPGTTRGNAGLERLYGATFDFDSCDVGHMEQVIAHVRRLGLAAVVYSSWSHGLADKSHPDSGAMGPFDSFRVCLPFTREVSPEEYMLLAPAIVGHELPSDPAHYAAEVRGKWIDRANGTTRAARPRGLDPASARPSQAYFCPAPHSTVDIFIGSPISVESVLVRAGGQRALSAIRVTRNRPRQDAQPVAVAALRDMHTALVGLGFGLGPEGFSGWHRSVCPSCQDVSPSLRVRSNGTGLDIVCFAGCKRDDILSGLGLQQDGRMSAPSELRILLEEQLASQDVGEAIGIDAAVEALTVDIRESVLSRRPTVVKYPAGTGKSHASAIVITERVRAGQPIVYATQEHVVAHETRMKLPMDVQARSVHIHSPLVQVGTGPVCRRKAELSTQVFDFGVSLLGKVCPKCPFNKTCEALGAAKARQGALANATAVFVSHAGIGQVIGTEDDGSAKGGQYELIVDEMPGAFQAVKVSAEDMERIATDPAALAAAHPTGARTAREIARAWLASETPGQVTYGPGGSVLGQALELAAEWGRLALAEGRPPAPSAKPLLQAGDALIRLAAWHQDGGEVFGLGEAHREGVSAMMPDQAHSALLARNGTLLSATPLLPALPGFAVRERTVTDGARVRRVMVLRGDRGSRAMQWSYQLPDGTRTRRQPAPGEALGIPWEVIDAALQRAKEEADKYTPARVLFVTFKGVADAMRARYQYDWLDIAHYGALRGRNNWMEGKPSECSVIYCLGTPRGDVLPTLYQLGLVGEAAEIAWRDYAAGELTQAEGRLRLPRRTKPCSVMIEGDCAPSTWTTENVSEVL